LIKKERKTFKAISGETIRQTIIPFPPLPNNIDRSKVRRALKRIRKRKEQLHQRARSAKKVPPSRVEVCFKGKLTNNNVKDDELPKGWKVCPISISQK